MFAAVVETPMFLIRVSAPIIIQFPISICFGRQLVMIQVLGSPSPARES